MNEAFVGLLVLSAALWAHAGYTWKQKRGGAQAVLGTLDKVLLWGAAGLCAAALCAGVIGMLLDWESAMVYTMGLLLLVLSLWGNGQVRRICERPSNH